MYGYIPLILMMIAISAMVYFMMITPLRQREKEHDKLLMDLDIGDTVITAGGMYGKVDRIDEGSVILAVESDAKVRVTKGCILKKE